MTMSWKEKIAEDTVYFPNSNEEETDDQGSKKRGEVESLKAVNRSGMKSMEVSGARAPFDFAAIMLEGLENGYPLWRNIRVT